MKKSDWVEKLTSPFKAFGLTGGLAYFASRLVAALPGSSALYVYDFMVQPVVEGSLLPTRIGRNLEIREIPPGDPHLELMPPSAEAIHWRFEQGAFCLGAFSKGQLVAYIWFCHGRYNEDEVRCDYVLNPADQSVFDFDVYVFPEHRMGLAFFGLWNGANHLLYERGIRYSFSRLTRFNRESRSAHEKLGWARVGGAVVLRTGNVEWLFASISPYVAISNAQARRPQVRLSTTDVNVS
jgi:hypothetical protein